MAASYNTCPTCDGHGLIKNVEAAALAALRRLQTRSIRTDVGRVRLTLAPDVANWLLNNKRGEILSLERQRGVHVEIGSQPTLLRHESQYETFVREEPVESPIPDPPAPEAAASPPPAAANKQAPPSSAAKSGDTQPRATPAGGKAGSTESPSGAGDQEPREPRRRKRRRRRRRSAEDASNTDSEAATREQPSQGVPLKLRVDELMPAASGAAQRAEQRHTRRKSGRRGGGRSRK